MAIERAQLQEQIERQLCSKEEFAHPQTRRFFRDAVLDGTVERYLNKENLDPRIFRARERAYRMAIVYFGSSASLEQVGQIYGDGITNERIRQLIKWTISKLHKTATPLTQNRNPLNEITLNKYSQLNTLLERGSRRGNRDTQAAILARVGASYGEIALAFGIKAVKNARRYRKFGIEIPYSDRTITSQKIRQQMADPDLNYYQVNQLWAKTSLGVARNNLTKEGLAISLDDLIGYAGVHIRLAESSLIFPFLEKAALAYGHYQRAVKAKNGKLIPKNYYFIRKIDLPKAIQALEQAESLKPFFENPVKLISQAEDFPIPNTTQLLNKRGFDYLNNLFKRHGLDIRYLPVSVEEFLEDCPYPVYAYYGESNGAYSYSTRFKIELGTFIKEKAQKLGLKAKKRATK